MKYRNVIFDLDGTLLDTSRGIIESIQYTIAQTGMRELSEQELMAFMGPPLTGSFEKICGCSEEEAQQATGIFRSHYQKGAVFHAKPYDGIAELCRKLRELGMKIGVATNKPGRFAVPLIQKFGLDKYIDPVFGADESGKLSKSDLIRLCTEAMGGSQADTVLIGDTVNDSAGAERAGVAFIAVTYGFGFRSAEDAAGYPCIGTADIPMQILRILMDDF